MMTTNLTPETPEIMACGHPRACLVSATDEDDGTVHCAWCESMARWEELLGVATECMAELEAEAKLNAEMLAHQCDLAREAELEVVKLRKEATDAEDDAERIGDALSQIAAYDEELYQVAGEARIQYVVEDVLKRLRGAEDEVAELKAQLRLVQGKAASRAGRLPR